MVIARVWSNTKLFRSNSRTSNHFLECLCGVHVHYPSQTVVHSGNGGIDVNSITFSFQKLRYTLKVETFEAGMVKETKKYIRLGTAHNSPVHVR